MRCVWGCELFESWDFGFVCDLIFGISYNFAMSLPRPVAWTGFGVVLLVVSIAVAMWAMRDIKDVSPVEKPPSPTPTAVCLGRVDVPSGVVSLHPTQPGRVEEVRAKEGQQVQCGQVLLVMDGKMAEQLVVQARQDVEAARAQLELAQKVRKQHELREAEQQAAVDVARARVKQAEGVLTRKKEIVALGQANEKELTPLIAQVEEAQAALRAEERKLDEIKLLRTPTGQKPLEIHRAEADLAAKEARLRQAGIGLAECQVVAPTRGAVLRVLVAKGDVLGLQAARPAILFLPDEELIIRAEIEQEVAAKVREGQPVVIEDDAMETVSYKGKVHTLSRWFAQRRSVLLEPGQLNDARTLEAIIRLDPPQPTDAPRTPLRIGQRVRVVIYEQ
jgi:HlyD family secretion protein